jgi:hypothetical protein
MKLFILLSLLMLFSCAKENVFPQVKSAGEQVASKSALWWDASAQKKDPNFLNGIRDLSNNDRNCFSNTYPLLDAMSETGVAILRGERRHILSCPSIDLSFMEGYRDYTIILAFNPTAGANLLQVFKAGSPVLNLLWLQPDQVQVMSGSGVHWMLQAAPAMLPENEIAIMRFEYRHLEIDFRDRQRIWLNGAELSLGTISNPAEGVILEDLSNVKIQSQTAAEMASLLFFDKRLSDKEVSDVECELAKKYKVSALDC